MYVRDASSGSSFDFVGEGMLWTSNALLDNASNICKQRVNQGNATGETTYLSTTFIACLLRVKAKGAYLSACAHDDVRSEKVYKGDIPFDGSIFICFVYSVPFPISFLSSAFLTSCLFFQNFFLCAHSKNLNRTLVRLNREVRLSRVKGDLRDSAMG